MTEVVLKDYLDEINRLIEESHLEEAVEHCRHLVTQFPRHVDSYRLLGKALLEKEDFTGAVDVFQRVLSADPEDYIAHAGIAIIRKHENRLREAAWHMERAFEAEPYNGAIREALQDMIGRRDGLPPERLSLTRAALARLYVRGELYSHAIGDLREALSEQPDRIDLQLLLAEALWRDGQRIDAAEECVRVLETLPNCVKANAILAEVCLVTDRADEAQNYLRRVFELTLPTTIILVDDSAVRIAFTTEGSPPLPDRIMVERAGMVPDAAGAPDAAEWINDLDFGDELIIDDVEPTWLGELQVTAELLAVDDDVHEPETVTEGPTADAAGPTTEGTNWFSRPSDQLPGIGEIHEETDWDGWLEPGKESGMPVERDAQIKSSETEEVVMAAMDERGRNEEEFPEADEPRGPDAGDSDAEESGLDWLDELQDAAGPEQDAALPGMADEDLPDWLREGVDINDMAADDLEWLEEDEPPQSSEAEQAATGAEQLPDWLREDMGLAEDAGTTGDDLSWLDQIAAGEGAAIDEPPTMSWSEPGDSEADIYEESWDDDLLIGEAYEGDEGSQEPAPAEDEWEGEMASEIEAAGETADDVPEDLEEAMAWLEQLAAQQGAPADELPSLQSASEGEDGVHEAPAELGEAMDWLDELGRMDDEEAFEPLAFSEEEDTGEFATPGEDVWLQDIDSEEAPSTVQEQDALHLEAGIGRAEPDPHQGELEDESLFLESELESGWDEEATESFGEEAPEDIDEAMAWLEQLAAQQGAPVDELPSLQQAQSAQHGEEREEDREADAPGSDEAMDWLEHLAASEEEDEFATLAGLDDAEDERTLDALGDIPDDPDLALAWLEGLAEEGQPVADVQDDAPVVDEQATPPVPHDVVAARAEAEAILAHDAQLTEDDVHDSEMLEDIPDDPDEAMAWLERLAARQGAPMDELPSLADRGADVEDEWLAEESWESDQGVRSLEEVDHGGMVDDSASPDPNVAIDSVDEGAAAILGEDDDEASAGGVESEDALTTGDLDQGADLLYEMEMSDEELEEGLPDWLVLDDEEEDTFDWDEPAFGATGWLDAEETEPDEKPLPAEEPDDGTMALEELDVAPTAKDFEGSAVDEADSARDAEEQLDDGPEDLVIPGEPEEVIEPLGEEEVSPAEEVDDFATDGATELEEARQALAAGEVESALPVYQSLAARGTDLSSIIADLEKASEKSPNQPALLQTLGDAYNQNGQLQKALDAYRRALDLL